MHSAAFADGPRTGSSSIPNGGCPAVQLHYTDEAFGRRRASSEPCFRLLLKQAVALRHKARYTEFLWLSEPSKSPNFIKQYRNATPCILTVLGRLLKRDALHPLSRWSPTQPHEYRACHKETAHIARQVDPSLRLQYVVIQTLKPFPSQLERHTAYWQSTFINQRYNQSPTLPELPRSFRYNNIISSRPMQKPASPTEKGQCLTGSGGDRHSDR